MLRVVRIKDLRESVFNTFIKGCVTLNTPQLFDRERDDMSCCPPQSRGQQLNGVDIPPRRDCAPLAPLVGQKKR